MWERKKEFRKQSVDYYNEFLIQGKSFRHAIKTNDFSLFILTQGGGNAPPGYPGGTLRCSYFRLTTTLSILPVNLLVSRL